MSIALFDGINKGGFVAHFAELRKLIATYMSDDSIEQIHEAYQLSLHAHKGQNRLTGEPYIIHPVAVAKILAEMRMDSETIMAALLHDVIEDTAINKHTIADKFGEQVAELVDGVSKLTQMKFQSRAEQQAENFRKMILAVAKDLRVILVKLADRLHNMQTVKAHSPEKRRRIALETLEIFAPIANRLGMHGFRVKFEDLGYAALYPMRYRVLKKSVEKARGNRKEIMSVIKTALEECLQESGRPECTITGREKHLYSIYKKMRNKSIPFAEIMDVYAFRIITDDVDSCYRVLGAVHNLYKPVPERFKDYIAIPKANGYQSLHTILFGPYGVPIEIQIRSKEMNALANSGIAAHWLYKVETIPTNTAHIRAQEWLKRVVEMQNSTGSSLEFIENIKIDLFPDEVYVFTPKGNILELPNGASVVDFAYAIHTDIGNTCIAAKINRRIAPLSTKLSNGQTVEIITSPGAQPNPAWLNFVITGKARSSIKHFLKKQRTNESVELGKRLLIHALTAVGLALKDIPQKNIQKVLAESHCDTLDDLFEETGLGNQIPLILARRLACVEGPKATVKENEIRFAGESLSRAPLLIKGTEGMALNFSTCCRPIPGDVIIGVLEAGRGIAVHREQCKKVHLKNSSDPYVFLSWEGSTEGDFAAEIIVETLNRRGVLANLAMSIAYAEANIENINVDETDGDYSVVGLTLSVTGRKHLASVVRRIRKMRDVTKIYRKR